jgi:gamma-glutamylcyclotransferase (GGCT)/AIG2-like uncharacterized protein YtfP
MEMKMSSSKINFYVSIMSEDDEEVQKYHADHGFPLKHTVDINATYDSGIAWPTLLEKACEVIGAYYGYDVKEKVFVKQFDKIVNIFGHDDPANYETDSDADENPAT